MLERTVVYWSSVSTSKWWLLGCVHIIICRYWRFICFSDVCFTLWKTRKKHFVTSLLGTCMTLIIFSNAKIHTHIHFILFIPSSAFSIFLWFACIHTLSHINANLMAVAKVLHRGCCFYSDEDGSSFCGILWHWTFIIPGCIGVWSVDIQGMCLVGNSCFRAGVGKLRLERIW